MLKRFITRAGVAACVTVSAALGITGTASAQPGLNDYIGYGQTNNTHAVWCVQHMANYFFSTYPGYGHPQISEDGQFGPQTDEAIRFVQAKSGSHLTADGIVGPQTGEEFLTYGDPGYGIHFDDQTLKTSYSYCYGFIPSTT
ncbi:peptidoglycan-binding protein [Streptomyces sp. NPDC006692]|uniref:peptidoglycan-binding domain-containing protein n=1 Tax=Streptomyces sp. NPDC006692 TaxID=3364758 RepID=UPI003694E7AE